MKPSSVLNRVVWTLLGAFLGVHVPAGWLLFRLFEARRDSLLAMAGKDLSHNLGFYIFLTVLAVSALSLAGLFIGWKYDRLESESESNLVSLDEMSVLAATDRLTGLLNGAAVRERLQL